ncbi:hypothetical protein ACETAC_02940 [Aceticella autotrophica]|uniref:Uncharacterized protein n=1 Tax=Aceticella autotrophica TaxID=2755338 RepID=A0A975AWP0_9THEO|nr:hypothetical protein [Aceticella autotrophica]QSZ27859.1 hypothetical protein ACETAC_02940 [Aceticella autotrophica]
MRYSILNKNNKLIICLLMFIIILLMTVVFVSAFVKINLKGLNILSSLLLWGVFIIIIFIISMVFFSLILSRIIITEKYLILSLGFMWFVRIPYDSIKTIEEYNCKGKIPAIGCNVKGNVCHMHFSKDNLLKIELKEPADIYFLMFFKKYADSIVFSASNSNKLKTEIENKI